MTLRATRLAAYGAAVAALLAVFALYTRPDMMVAVGDMIWACFQ
ncbi:MAG TPA: hypothetical protein VNB23_04040 [Ramlibacter sp.]|nr:hypothetical protein [Ramlibacter sp.]